MFFAPAMTPTATDPSPSRRRSLRSHLSVLVGTRASGKVHEANHAACMELYHADETTLRDMGLTRMDVIRLLETKGRAVEPMTARLANLPSQPATTPRGPILHRFPLVLLSIVS